MHKHRAEFYSHVRPELRALAERKERITKDELPERMNSYERRIIEPNLDNDILMERAEYCMSQAGRELGAFEIPRHYNDAVERLYAPLLVKRLREAEAEIARLRGRERTTERGNNAMLSWPDAFAIAAITAGLYGFFRLIFSTESADE